MRRASRARLLAVVGARPNFMKMAPILRALGAAREKAGLETTLVHTGQHYDDQLSGAFFRELRIPKPSVNLEVGSGSHARQTAEVMLRLEPLIAKARPAMTLVVGDVNSTLGAALAAAKLGIPVAHVEAGLRSFDRRMPEEANRVLTDALSDLLFVSEPSGVTNLRREGVPSDRIHLVGNVMIDTLLEFRKRAAARPILRNHGLERRRFVLVTLHRPENVDAPASLRVIVEALRAIADETTVVFPIHPRTRASLRAFGLEALVRGSPRLEILEPLGYLDFVSLLDRAALVLTDSGGVQEEAAILGVACLTRRDSTERPITLRGGANRLVPADSSRIFAETQALLRGTRLIRPLKYALWDGRAAERIAAILIDRLGLRSAPRTVASRPGAGARTAGVARRGAVAPSRTRKGA